MLAVGRILLANEVPIHMMLQGNPVDSVVVKESSLFINIWKRLFESQVLSLYSLIWDFFGILRQLQI